ncbi:MAG: hypothetical protein CL596_01460 [Alteromonas sp.]|nr:hypothetical protein [Alteromonas sp.]MAY22821.1 hypothetical protein [Flavobacteriaceae bacterium]|tara:strand:+ start:220 stop:429 length:210 start_codon:yes stop_codon:yes gene_type:complete
MRKYFLIASLAIFTLATTSCRDKETKVIVEEKPAVEEEDKGILEKVGEKVDDEVNKEIDEEIDKIGDDN